MSEVAGSESRRSLGFVVLWCVVGVVVAVGLVLALVPMAECELCKGQGLPIWSSEDACPVCKGEGKISPLKLWWRRLERAED